MLRHTFGSAALTVALVCAALPAAAAAGFQSDFCKAGGNDYGDYAKLQSALGRPSAAFGTRLLRALSRENREAKAFVSSPYGIATALAMVLVGARGKTAEELAEGLSRQGFPTGAALKLEAVLTRLLQCPREYQSTQLNVADRIYLQKNEALDPTYVKTLKEAFDVSVGEVDYVRNSDGARSASLPTIAEILIYAA